MLELEGSIQLTPENIDSKNLTSLLSDKDLTALGAWVHKGYTQDIASRSVWEQRTSAAMDLAMQLTKAKNFPWPNCSNIAFPLVTIAVLQFHSRAYPALVRSPDLVRARVTGEDPQGVFKAEALKISLDMSYQILEEDSSWEEQHDRLLINLPCVGCAFKKTYRLGDHNTSELVLAKDLVMDYWATSVDACPRKTHVIPLFRNDIYTRVKRGQFRDILNDAWYNTFTEVQQSPTTYDSDQRKGTNPPQPDESTPFITLEQHVDVDLDQDGYAEPYIITIEEDSKKVLRIVTAFHNEDAIERAGQEIVSITRHEYFTKYSFIPSPDGGIYDIGYGVLLGPLNETTNSIINQMLDAGTMQLTGGGFLGKGARIRGGDFTFAPGEWKPIEFSGIDDIRKVVMPRPDAQIPPIMFQLLSLIIDYTNRVSSSTDVMVGENPGQNTPAETSRNMVREGQRIYSSIYRRIWRSMKQEFKKWYILNGLFLPIGERELYLNNPDRIVPAADPSVVSDEQSLQRAMVIKQNAMSTPGYNLVEVEHDLLMALHFSPDEIARLYPGPGKTPPLPNPKLEVEKLKMQGVSMNLEFKKQSFMLELMEQRRLNTAKIANLEAMAIKYSADASGVEAGHQLEAFNAALGALKLHNEQLMQQIQSIQQEMSRGTETDQGTSGLPGMAGPSGGQTPPQVPTPST